MRSFYFTVAAMVFAVFFNDYVAYLKPVKIAMLVT